MNYIEERMPIFEQQFAMLVLSDGKINYSLGWRICLPLPSVLDCPYSLECAREEDAWEEKRKAYQNGSRRAYRIYEGDSKRFIWPWRLLNLMIWKPYCDPQLLGETLRIYWVSVSAKDWHQQQRMPFPGIAINLSPCHRNVQWEEFRTWIVETSQGQSRPHLASPQSFSF